MRRHVGGKGVFVSGRFGTTQLSCGSKGTSDTSRRDDETSGNRDPLTQSHIPEKKLIFHLHRRLHARTRIHVKLLHETRV